MNTLSTFVPGQRPALIAAAVAAILMAACASTPVEPQEAADARHRLTLLQSDPQLATRAPAARKDAELAVAAAEQPHLDPLLAQYRAYIADREVDIAVARARTSLAEDQRKMLVKQGDEARLDARTREADVASGKLANADALIAEQRTQIDVARTQVDAAVSSAAASQQQSADLQLQSADLQRQLDELHAKQTDRGMVLTLGDTLFTSSQSDLKAGATVNLAKLVAFLSRYADRDVLIEGYTDSVGSDEYNLELSQRRADAVKAYLISQGIDSQRLNATGRGKNDPVADNGSADGRQQNRRVDVIIANAPVAAR